jgi:hypothetical protein
MISGNPERMDEADQEDSIEPIYSNNMTNLSVKRKEKHVTQILATKF